MKRLLLFLFFIAPLSAYSQTKYEGLISADLGITSDMFVSADIITEHGMRIKSVYLGLGTGVENHTSGDEFCEKIDIPIYLTIKYDILTGSRITPFISLDSGISLIFKNDGFNIGKKAGASIGLSFRNKVFLQATSSFLKRSNQSSPISYAFQFGFGKRF